MQAYVDYILDHDDTYAICMGDLTETATRYSIGAGVYEQQMDPDTQIDVMVEILKPLADAGKLIGIHGGNHEYRGVIVGGTNPARGIANILRVPYLGFQAFHVVKVAKQVYIIMSFHGTGSGRTKGSKIEKLLALSKIADCDVYIMGHHHTLDYTTQLMYKVDVSTGNLIPHVRHFVCTGSLLGYFNNYSEMQGLQPTLPGLVKIQLSAKNHDVKVVY